MNSTLAVLFLSSISFFMFNSCNIAMWFVQFDWFFKKSMIDVIIWYFIFANPKHFFFEEHSNFSIFGFTEIPVNYWVHKCVFWMLTKNLPNAVLKPVRYHYYLGLVYVALYPHVQPCNFYFQHASMVLTWYGTLRVVGIWHVCKARLRGEITLKHYCLKNHSWDRMYCLSLFSSD